MLTDAFMLHIQGHSFSSISCVSRTYFWAYL